MVEVETKWRTDLMLNGELANILVMIIRVGTVGCALSCVTGGLCFARSAGVEVQHPEFKKNVTAVVVVLFLPSSLATN